MTAESGCHRRWNYCAISTLALCCVVAIACERRAPRKQQVVSPELAPGNITLELTRHGAEKDQFWHYRITPSLGEVERTDVGEHTIPYSTPHVNCFKGTEVISYDHRFVASCFGEKSGKRPQLTIKAAVSDKTIFEWAPPRSRGIAGFIWSSNSRCLALLTYSERHGRRPLDLIWSFAGHPVPVNTFYVELIDPQTSKSVEYVVNYDMRVGYGSILSWDNSQ